MKHRLLIIALLTVIFAAYAVLAQGAVVESVDEDIVEEEATATAPAPAAPAPASSALDLDALVSEDDHEADLLVGDKPIIQKADSDTSASSSAADSLSAAAAGVAASDTTTAGTGTAADTTDNKDRPGRRGAPPKVSVVKADTADQGPPVIEDGRTINFAQNLKDYKSPRIAMLLSLIVPGLGQAYSRNYVKAGAFIAAEAAAIGVTAYFNSKGDKAKKDAYRFADTRFDTTRLRNYGEDLKQEFDKRGFIGEDGELNVDNISPPFVQYNDDFFDAARSGQSYYYEYIRDGEFTPGWIDNDPSFDLANIIDNFDNGGRIVNQYGQYAPVTATANSPHFYLVRQVVDALGNAVEGSPIIGYSKDQIAYNSMMKDAKSYHDMANYTLYVLIVNHIASAIDAGFTAHAHNARLLGEETSFWNRLTVDPQYVFSGSDVSPGLMLRVRF